LNVDANIFPVAYMVIHCGRYGLFVWPMWFVADGLWVSADMLQYRIAPKMLWIHCLIGISHFAKFRKIGRD